MATEVQLDPSKALLDDFHNLFNISKPIENDTQRPHPKFSHYFRKFDKETEGDSVKRLQDQRRRELLDNIKRKREQILDNLRPLLNFIENDDSSKKSVSCYFSEKNNISNNLQTKDCLVDTDMNSSVEVKEEKMQVDSLENNKIKKQNKRSHSWWSKNDKEFRKLISKQLMLSEWLVDVPVDFYTDWYIMLCPKGKRTLVIAANGVTKIYSRTGYFICQFMSLLPGGGKTSKQKGNKKSCILDCIFVEGQNKLYVIDVISWNGCTFTDCETEFRFFWLHTRFNEEISVQEESLSSDVVMTDNFFDSSQEKPKHVSKFNQKYSILYDFTPLPHYDCTIQNIQTLSKPPYQFNTDVDGILFFHKRAPYVSGITPLVCWLKIPMIESILHISLS